MSKYGNKQAVASDRMVFSSKKECSRYEELLLLSKIGEIADLKVQVKFELIPKQDGERKVDYVADFAYMDRGGTYHVEDTKGFRTKDYIIKRKLMMWVHNIRIEEI